jgi:hypothetical protein
MTNDFGTDFAEELANYFISGTDITAPPTDVYVTLYDDTGTELNGDVSNGRVALSVGGDIQQGGDATQFENAVEVNFGEATSDITVQEFAIKDQDANDATALEYFRADVTNAPQSYTSGTRVFFAVGDLDVDILDQTNN